jgi:hypothetical protein
MRLALQLYVQAFGDSTRTPRSTAYQKGVKAALQRIFEGVRADMPYTAGTADFDAYVAGGQEGHQIAAAHKCICQARGDAA